MSYCSVSGPGGRESQDVLEEDILYATPVIVGPKVDFDNAFSKSTYNLFVPPPSAPFGAATDIPPVPAAGFSYVGWTVPIQEAGSVQVLIKQTGAALKSLCN